MPAEAFTVATEDLARCPNCNSEKIVAWVSGRDRLLRVNNQVFSYKRCENCDVAFQSPRPLEGSIHVYYPKDYGPFGRYETRTRLGIFGRMQGLVQRTSFNAINTFIGRPKFESKIQKFYEKLSEHPKILDFGCGSGKFLDKAMRSGCETIGMDFSEVALAQVASRGHRAFSVDEVGWNGIADGSIKLTRMNHVIEHLYNPFAVLQRLHAKMSPGGFVHIATPNSDSKSARIYGQHWFSLDCPRHIVLFTPATLQTLVARAGFEVLELLHEPLTKDMARSWLYRKIDSGRRRPEDVLSADQDALLNFRFAWASKSAAESGQSDRIHLFARKPLD